MQDLTVPISRTAYEVLKSLATHSGETLQAVLDKAVESYRRQLFLEEANRAYAALRNDTDAWAEELEEREAWDYTIADGVAEV
ncbi:MAG: toxin-antitoxin system protein [Cyanobacteria bacterium J06642_11]